MKMKKIVNGFLLVCMFGLSELLFNGTVFAGDPVVMLIQAKGEVWYQIPDSTWKPVHRNKFIYDGWKVKTGRGATCKLLHQNSNKVEALTPETEVIVGVSGTRVARGSISEKEAASTLPGLLKRKLAKIQKYTTVQRSGKNKERVDLKIPKMVVLNEEFPSLAWENVGKEYSYRLILGENLYEVPGSDGPIIRYRLSKVTPGEYRYQVQVLYEDEVLFTPKQTGKIIFLNKEKNKKLKEKITEIEDIDKENGYLLGNLLDDQGLTVAAMDQYRAFLKAHPEANEVRPFLVKVLHELGLDALREKEALLYRENAVKK